MTDLLVRSCLVTSFLFAACSRDKPDDPARTRGEHTTLNHDADRAPAKGVLPRCGEVPSSLELERYLKVVPGEREAGGLASGKAEWAAVVNREGELCAIAVSMPEPGQAWPGSQSIAKAK